MAFVPYGRATWQVVLLTGLADMAELTQAWKATMWLLTGLEVGDAEPLTGTGERGGPVDELAPRWNCAPEFKSSGCRNCV